MGGGLSYVKSGDQIYKKYGFSDPLFAYSIAVAMKKKMTPRLDAQFEIQAIRQGYSFVVKNYFDTDEIIARKKMISLTLNVLPTHRCYLDKKRILGLQLGAFSAYNMFHTWQYGDQKYSLTNDSEKSWNVGLVFGLKFEKIRKKKGFGFDLRFNQGLVDLSRDKELTRSRLIETGASYTIARIKK